MSWVMNKKLFQICINLASNKFCTLINLRLFFHGSNPGPFSKILCFILLNMTLKRQQDAFEKKMPNVSVARGLIMITKRWCYCYKRREEK